MTRVGIIGFGFMGRMHYRCWKEQPDARIVAVCDPDAEALRGDGAGQGNIAGAEGEVDLSDLTVYADPDEMLARERLDAVSITIPTHLHADCAVRALATGVHVLCEKPMALNYADGLRMTEAAGRAGKILQIGQCIRFWPEYVYAKACVDSGTYGRVITAGFRRLAATAHTKKGGWFADESLSGGMIFDLHIHDSDFVHYLFGMPESVCSHAAAAPAGGAAHIVTAYRYTEGKLVTAEGGWAMTPSYNFQMAYNLVLERASITFDSRSDPKLIVFPVDGKPFTPQLEAGDGYSRQVAHFVQRICGESVQPVITPEDALGTIRLAEAERESVRKGGSVNVR